MESGQIYINIEAPNMHYDINIRRRLIRSRRWKLSNGKSWMVRTKQRAYKLGTFRVICDSVTQTRKGNTFMLRPFILSETCKKNWSKFSCDCKFQKIYKRFLFAQRKQMKIFLQNRDVHASHEWPILEQYMGQCCPIFSCPDRPSKLRHFLMVKWLQTTQHKINKFCSLPV